jgi:hypothetical protein
LRAESTSVPPRGFCPDHFDHGQLIHSTRIAKSWRFLSGNIAELWPSQVIRVSLEIIATQVSEQHQVSADPRSAFMRSLRRFALALLFGAVAFALVAFEVDGAAFRVIGIAGGVGCLTGTAYALWLARRVERSQRP